MPRFHLALKAAFGYMLRAYPARDRRAEVRNARNAAFLALFPELSDCGISVPRQNAGAGYDGALRGTATAPAQREAEVRRPAVCVRRPKVFGAIGTGGASGNALRILRSPPPLQRSFNGLIISFPKISGIWGFHKFSFFPKIEFRDNPYAAGGENFGTAPAAVRGMRPRVNCARELGRSGAQTPDFMRFPRGLRRVSRKPLRGALRSLIFSGSRRPLSAGVSPRRKNPENLLGNLCN